MVLPQEGHGWTELLCAIVKQQKRANSFASCPFDASLVMQETEPHFIRCLKPNETKRPMEWDAPKVLNQLFSLSILEALQLRQIGYSYRRTFEDFVKRFKWLDLGAANSCADRKDVAKSMLEGCGLPAGEWVVRE